MGKKPFHARALGAAPMLIALAWSSCAPGRSHASDDSHGLLRLTADAELGEDLPAPIVEEKPRHVEFGIRDSCPRLDETKKILDQRLYGPLSLDAMRYFDKPETPIDRKSDFMLTTFSLGAGRQESDWLIWTVYLGGGMGRQHDHQRVRNLNLEVNFKYSYVFTGATAEMYPWRVPKREVFEDWGERLMASRPFVATGFETGYVSAEGRGHLKYALLPRMYQDKAQVRDWTASLNLGLGWNLPLNRYWSVVLMGEYRFHFYRPDEYNGWTVTTALRYDLP